MNTVTLRSDAIMTPKKVAISSKRQITIPQKFFTMLGFATEAECMVKGNELVIRPINNNTGGEFAEQILSELISEGYEGKELLAKFKEQQQKIRPAVEKMLELADAVADGGGDYETYDDIFGSEE